MTALRDLLAAAMPAPWAVVKYSKKRFGIGENGHGAAYLLHCVNVTTDDEMAKADAALIAHLRNKAEAYLALEEAARDVVVDGSLPLVANLEKLSRALKGLDE